MTVGMIALWAVLIYAIVWLVHSGSPGERGRPAPPDPPQAILEQRLAEDEISLDEYERLVDAIQDRRRTPAGEAGSPDG